MVQGKINRSKDVDAPWIFKKIQKNHLELNPKSKWYIESYAYFIDYFREKNTITEKDVIFGIAMAYSWMPTIPGNKLNEEKWELITKSNNFKLIKQTFETKTSIEDNYEEIISNTKEMVNNSLVGASKLLHFMIPDKFPIWDRKICGLWLGKGKTNNLQINKIDNYLAYKEWCDEIKLDKSFKKIKIKLKSIINQSCECHINIDAYSPYRIIDICLLNFENVREIILDHEKK